MPMGIVSESDFDKELNKISPSKDSEIRKEVEIIDVNRGRGNGNIEVPNTLRKVIGEESIINGRQAGIELAQSFGLSPSSVSAYANGSTSTASYDKQPNLPHLNETRTKVSKRAFGKLMKALHHITDDKLKSSDAKDLSSIAKDMSAVIRTMEPPSESNSNVGGGNSGPTFIFYSPQKRNEESYETVYAKE